MASMYEIRRAGKIIGVYSSADLRNVARDGAFEARDEIRKVGKPHWYPLAKVTGLFMDGAIQPVTSTEATESPVAPKAKKPEAVDESGVEPVVSVEPTAASLKQDEHKAAEPLSEAVVQPGESKSDSPVDAEPCPSSEHQERASVDQEDECPVVDIMAAASDSSGLEDNVSPPEAIAGVEEVEPTVDEISMLEEVEPAVDPFAGLEEVEPPADAFSGLEGVEPTADAFAGLEEVQLTPDAFAELEEVEPTPDAFAELEDVEPTPDPFAELG